MKTVFLMTALTYQISKFPPNTAKLALIFIVMGMFTKRFSVSKNVQKYNNKLSLVKIQLKVHTRLITLHYVTLKLDNIIKLKKCIKFVRKHYLNIINQNIFK
jgi:hypothetical protein